MYNGATTPAPLFVRHHLGGAHSLSLSLSLSPSLPPLSSSLSLLLSLFPCAPLSLSLCPSLGLSLSLSLSLSRSPSSLLAHPPPCIGSTAEARACVRAGLFVCDGVRPMSFHSPAVGFVSEPLRKGPS